jgi:hypothetical protein
MLQSTKVQYPFICLLFMLIIGCGGSGSGSGECKYKPPTAIFENVQGFTDHSFEVKGQDAVEKVNVPGMKLSIELYQSGCNAMQQEYRLLLDGTYPLNTAPDLCAMDIAEIFYNLSQQAPNELGLLQQWAGAIQKDAKAFQYNEKVLFQDSDVSAEINKTHQSSSAMLTIIFSQ